MIRIALGLAVLALAGCVTQSTSETGNVRDAEKFDARRRAEVHTSLAGEYYQRGAIGVALEATRRAVKEDPNYATAWNMQGLILMELREDANAREAFERAMRLEPNNSEVLNNYGWVLCLRNEHARGLEMMQRAAADPLYPTPEKSYLSSGLCMRRANRLADAEQFLRRAVAIRPDLIGALYNLAELTYERGNHRDAEIYLLRYMRLAQPSLEALILGVRISRAKGEKVAEDSFMQQLRRRFPDAPQLRELEGK